MPLPTRRAGAALALCAATALVTSGCAAGVDALTLRQGPPGDGASTTNGDLLGRGLVLVLHPGTGVANLLGTMINMGDQPDALTAVTVTGGTTRLSDGGTTVSSISMRPRTSFQVGYADNQPSIDVAGLPAQAGQFVTVTLAYRDGGSATTQVLTVAEAGIWDGLAPSPTASVG